MSKWIHLAFLLLLAISSSTCTEKSELEYSINSESEKYILENQLQVVKNQENPIYGEIDFILEDDLHIGTEKRTNYLFYRIRSIQVDEKDNIYVLDSGNHRVQMFDKDGRYIKTLGQKGQGPYEFQSPTGFRLDRNSNHLCISDLMTIKIFDINGEYISQCRVSAPVLDFFPDVQAGFFWLSIPKYTKSGMIAALNRTNLNGEIVLEHTQFPMKSSINNQGGMYYVVVTGYEHRLHFSELDKNSIVYGYSNEYKLNIIDKSGRLKKVIYKNEPIIKLSRKEKERLSEYKLSNSMPYFYRILIDSHARIFLQRSYKGLDRNIPRVYDVFSQDGYYLYRTTLPASTYIINCGYLYTVIVDRNTNIESIMRHRIVNWDKIKFINHKLS